jgi:hypothetical protein
MNNEQKEPLPELTHLQFVILEALGSRVKRGKQLREDLMAHGVRKSGPAFYQLMARLEEAKFVKGWYEQEIIEGQIIKERHYQLLGLGADAMNQTKNFYQGKLAIVTH